MVAKNLENYGLLYGSRNEIRAWHAGLSMPFALARTKQPHITSLAFDSGKGILYYAGHDGAVRNAITNESVGKTQKDSPIFDLDFLDEKLIAVRHISQHHNAARLHYVKSDMDIAILDSDMKGRKGLSYRPHSLELTVSNNGKIYIASENIVEVCPPKKNDQKPKIKKLTNYLSDFVNMVKNGEDMYAVFTHNHDSYPDGTEVRKVPSNKRVTFWKPDESWGGLEHLKKSYGYTDMATIIDDKLIVGTHNFDTEENNIYYVNLTPEMHESARGIRAKPQLLLRQAYEHAKVYGRGNPMILIPRKELDILIQKIILH